MTGFARIAKGMQTALAFQKICERKLLTRIVQEGSRIDPTATRLRY